MAQNLYQMVTSAVSDRGLNEKRAYNEDSYLEMPERGIFAVADGVGGAQAGDVASQMAMEQLAEAFSNLPEGGDVEEMLHRAITSANNAIYQMSHDLPQLSTMATTIVSLHISGNIATIGHAGDSRLYRLDSKGNLFRETQDHSVVEEEVRAGRMTPEQAENHPSKNVISRALGAESTVEVDMKTIMFEPNTTFLLCSDGITRHISDVEIRELLDLPHPPVDICQQMKEICFERGAEDNLTAVIVRIGANQTTQIEDSEENTVASTRPLMETPHQFEDLPTQDLEIPNAAQFAQAETIENVPQMEIPATQPIENSVTVSSNESVTQTVKAIERDDNYYAPEEKKSGGFFSKLLTFILGLLIGAALGAGGYYYWLSTQPVTEPQVPQFTKMESKNILFESFETARRNVDLNPDAYIKSGAKTEDAEGYYLLGRAYLLTGKNEEALQVFAKAQKALDDYKGESKTTLLNEIAIASSLLASTESTMTFARNKNKSSANTANSNVSSNVANENSVSNANSSNSNSAKNTNSSNSNSK